MEFLLQKVHHMWSDFVLICLILQHPCLCLTFLMGEIKFSKPPHSRRSSIRPSSTSYNAYVPSARPQRHFCVVVYWWWIWVDVLGKKNSEYQWLHMQVAIIYSVEDFYSKG